VGRADVEGTYELFPELRPLARRRAGTLSGGEQQMLSLGRALTSGPTALLIDEFSLGLAPIVVERLLNAIRAAADGGLAVMIVEQQVARALRVADRGYVLSHGEIAMEGTAQELGQDSARLTSSFMS